MKKWVKIVVVVILALVVAGAGIASYMKPMGVKTVTLEPEEAYAYFIETGTVIEGTDFMLYPEVSGAVVETLVEKGDYVRAGDVIINIDTSEYERQIGVHEANISGYYAQIESAKEAERNAKDDYRATISSLGAQLAQIEAQRKSAEAARLSAPSVSEQLSLLRLTIDETKTDIRLTEESVDKLEKLYASGALSKSALDDAKNELDASRAALHKLEIEYEQTSGKQAAGVLAEVGDEELFNAQRLAANEQINALSKNLDKDYSGAMESYYLSLIDAETLAISSIRDNIGKCALKTPVTGYISDFPAKSLSSVSAQNCAAVIKTEGDIKIESYVSTKDAGTLKEGGEVVVVLKGRDEDKTFEGNIESISKWAETKTTALGLDEKKVRVVITVMDTESSLISGSDIDARYTVYRERNKLLIPTGAVFTNDGTDYVFTVKDGKAVKTKIIKGVKTLTDTVVESGLNAGDIVISEANTAGLKEGIRVKPE